MRRITLTLMLLAVFGITACDSGTSPELAAPEIGPTVDSPALSVQGLASGD